MPLPAEPAVVPRVFRVAPAEEPAATAPNPTLPSPSGDWPKLSALEAEQFKILRTKLLFPLTDKKPPRSIMVTSAVPGEGKSFVAGNLAVSIAESIDQHVLLMDCDLRSPSIHKQFGLEDYPGGLSEHLTQDIALPDLLLKTPISKLTILPAGKPPSNPSELLSSARMARLIEEVTLRYPDRLIIVDSPPPKMTSESNAISRHVDAILIVIRYRQTPKELVSELIESLEREKIVGIVLNWYSSLFLDSNAKYYYKYYSSTAKIDDVNAEPPKKSFLTRFAQRARVR